MLIDWFDRNGFNVNELPIDKWAELFAKSGRRFDEMPPDLAKDFGDDVRQIDGAIRRYLGESEQTLPLDELLNSLHAKASHLKAKTIDDMLRILDEDIAVLRDFTSNAVIRAIGLERAFISVIVKNINFIRRGITDSDGGSRKFDEWINLNVRKILDSEFAAIDRYNMDSQTRKSIVAALQQVLGSME